jgi:hypothetical protein
LAAALTDTIEPLPYQPPLAGLMLPPAVAAVVSWYCVLK